MKTKKYLFILLGIFIVSCNTSTKKGRDDEFYTDKGSFDMGRFPLIKPFELNVTDGDNWLLSANKDSTVLFTIDGVKGIRVFNHFILAHAVNTTINYARAKEGWFVIIPKSHFSKGVATHQEYLNLLYQVGLNKEPDLYKPNDVFDYFDKHDTINWK